MFETNSYFDIREEWRRDVSRLPCWELSSQAHNVDGASFHKGQR